MVKTNTKQARDGWQCPNCNKGWSPMRASCDCVNVKKQSRKEVVEEVEKELDGLDCGFCNYGDEVKLRLKNLIP